MAGRLHVQQLPLARLLPSLKITEPLIESPNLAPRQPVSAIRMVEGALSLAPLFWGLTPPWLTVLDNAPHCARAETLDQRGMFQEAYRSRRCLVPVSGFYIWKRLPRAKQPYLVTQVTRGPLLLAGLWCRYHTTLTAFTDSTALVTVPANACLSPLTDRLPAVIGAQDADTWLNPDTDSATLDQLLAPAPLELLGAFPVSKQVNVPTNQSTACAHPTGSMIRWITP
ncbi:SOS response-associated peptidase [Vreelandella arcis]|uniref:Abasic site processing protein n=1 Tax=Vreelandella arcis TaxID=416873 RepID=A0A1H0BYQ4_9GAMM|nr:SOS response-associated peptidase [Halomonas arcis]SDN50759.1 Putative SOS response-associated peptidase YedK [Halomonas arcis]